MHNMLSKHEMQTIVSDLPMEVGKQHKLNHEECPAGSDHKHRLYVKNNGDGWLFYCHHCGSKGFLRTPDYIRRADELHTTKEWFEPTSAVTDAGAEELWLNGYRDMCDWPIEARIWWMGYELGQEDAHTYGVRWSAETSRLMLRASTSNYQGRGFNKKPKYLTWMSHPDQISKQVQLDKRNKRVILVEDLVSSYKLHKAGCDVVCLMGTKIRENHIVCVFNNYSEALIWLDDDEAGKVGAFEVDRQLHSLMRCDVMVNKQPKELPLSYLKGIADV